MATRRSARLITRAELLSPAPPASALKVSTRKRKAADVKAEAEAGAQAGVAHSTPSTPRKRRGRPSGTAQAPVTPPSRATTNPFGAQDLGASPLKKPTTPAVTRLADPLSTNAPLISPMTSRLVAPKSIDAVSPSKVSSIRTTTANLLEVACAHLIEVDPRMKPLVEKHTCTVFSPERLAEKVDPFEYLVSSIISQQVSGAAAKSIKARFLALFDDLGPRGHPQPPQVAPCSIERLRSAGLSQRKAEYIQGLAEKFCNGELSAQMIAEAPYEDLMKKLVAVRGLGVWTVEMFAVFALKRIDVCSMGDLGVQRGMAQFVGKDVAKLKSKGGKWKYMSEQEMRELSEKFAPYRSVFMWYMWQILETDVSTMEKSA
ncbi:related to MAG1 - 3-methyladenine DNA glycosylase [Cephalotrichum gorgonifer]|uniref:Related to MAG1 - 3-methyladenine DNA glycosylase n=1 Tax=Cephalotrichum gorgonifer TaxID=2041049 RepID=A0AAE8SRH3_9PEZI|nr:related to MAG1 - 3-methyladenine DNA glycosylase [Cephalotrichum gorgonifer]